MKRIHPAERACPTCAKLYRSFRPHCGSASCHKQHRTLVRDLWSERNDIRAKHDKACKSCTFALDAESVHRGLKTCSACRIMEAQKKRAAKAQRKEDAVIERNADEAAIRITMLEFERRQQAAFAPSEQVLSFIEQSSAPLQTIAIEEA